MKSIRNIGLLVSLLALAPSVLRAGTWGAKPEHGKTYLISVGQDTKNVLTPYKYSWLRDTGLAFLAYAEGNDAQKWKLVAVSGKQDCYQLVNGDGELAFDMALNDTKKVSGYPCMWTQSIANPNQQIYITKKGSGYKLSAVSVRNGQTYYVTFGSISSVNGYYCGYANSEASAATLQFKEVPAVVIPEGADWENAKVYERNKERAHATYMPYPSTKAMKADGQRYDKPWLDPTGANYLSLNGTWKLRWSEGAKPVLLGKDDFWGDGVSTEGSAWNDITVPSCLEMNGYGLPMYVNVDYPFEDQQPYVRMKAGLKNSVGSYRRDFTLPAGWENKRVFLHFDGIYSAAYVYVNGNEVGYTEGANNVSEFDITKYLRTGKNNVAVQVIRWSDGSYLEGQDMWHMSGIHRDVYLVATPKTYLADHYIKATVTPGSTTVATGSAATSVDLTVCNRDKTAAKKTVTVTLFDPSGKEVKRLKSDFVFAAGDSLKTQTVDFGTLSNVKLWSAETPTLYTFTFSQSQDGKEEEAFSTKYGFRKIDLSKGYLEVNGRRTYLKGANTQDTDPLHGRSISTDLMLKDISMMKQSNMNTVRTSHYPRHAKMMAMFDYFGLFVVDEADMELHKNWDGVKTIINNRDWTGAIVDRNVRNTLRDRNHPSVVFWSLGNESGSGLNIMAAYNAVKELDNRYIHYEGSTRDNAEGTDLHSVMYPAVDHSRGGTTGPVTSDANHPSTGKPYFMCEYAHAMGNAVGNLREYWEAIEGSQMGVGGCIWDWVDQSIYSYDAIKNNQLTKNGFPAYITGFDCPGPHQYNFVNNGLVNADRAWSAELDEVKRVYQWVAFDLNTTSRQVKLTNKYLDRNLDQFYLKWTLLADGKPVQDGIVKKLNCAAGGTEIVDLKYNPTAFAGKELFLNIGLYTKEATNWCDRDYPVAEFQQQLAQLRACPISAKFGGATGNYNAHHVAYPEHDWAAFGDRFVSERLGLTRERFTTQISNYDNLAAVFDAMRRIHTILIDLDRDFWQYVSMEYFKQQIKAGEVGSSAMPHKVNPIDFENSEGNLGIANAILDHLSTKLPISRLQRDLTDSTVIRNIGVPMGHALIAFASTLKGLGKLLLREETLRHDLENNWAVCAEAIQTILRREGYPHPYEALKALTRTNAAITEQSISDFIDELNVSDAIRAELHRINPSNYTGI